MSAQLSKNDVGAYQLSGELTFKTVNALYQRSDDMFATGNDITIDLQHVSHVDSAGLVLLLEWARRTAQKKGHLRFSGIPDQLETLVRINGLQDVIAAGT